MKSIDYRYRRILYFRPDAEASCSALLAANPETGKQIDKFFSILSFRSSTLRTSKSRADRLVILDGMEYYRDKSPTTIRMGRSGLKPQHDFLRNGSDPTNGVNLVRQGMRRSLLL